MNRLQNIVRTIFVVIGALRVDIRFVLAGAIWGFAAGFLTVNVFEVKVPETGNVLGIAAVMTNVFIVAPFIAIFRSLAASEWWQRALLLRIPPLAFGFVLGLIPLTRGSLGDMIQLSVWLMATGLAMAFFSASPQSRAFQQQRAQHVGLFARCATVGKVFYQLGNLGLPDLGDELLTAIKPGNWEALEKLIERICSTYFVDVYDVCKKGLVTELRAELMLPPEPSPPLIKTTTLFLARGNSVEEISVRLAA